MRGNRKEKHGVVVSDKMDKTIVVRVDRTRSHPKYGKTIKVSNKFHAHDEKNEAKNGDEVVIVESRKFSKTKNWRLLEIKKRSGGVVEENSELNEAKLVENL